MESEESSGFETGKEPEADDQPGETGSPEEAGQSADTGGEGGEESGESEGS